MHMPSKTLIRSIALGVLGAMTLASPVNAQTPVQPVETTLPAPLAAGATEPETAANPAQTEVTRTAVDAYTSASQLTDGLQDWHEAGIRGTHTTGAHVLSGEVAAMRRFGESGNFLGLGDSYTFNPDWFGSLSIGAGDGASYLPKVRTDGFINRKLLADRNLIASLGAGYYSAPDGHNDRHVSVGATYYFDEPLILQGEVRINFSRPGNIKTRQQFLALTWGRAQATQITARYGWGREGYLAIGSGNSLVDFSSHQSSLILRHWLGQDWGLAFGLEQYHNPYYERTGISLGLFWEQP